MAEKLLNSVEVARRLGVSLRHFYRIEADLIANHGLGRMIIGRTKKYTESSLEQLIHVVVYVENQVAFSTDKEGKCVAIQYDRIKSDLPTDLTPQSIVVPFFKKVLSQKYAKNVFYPSFC